jgi:hypothetical protein
MRDNTAAGRQATVKDEGMTMAGTVRGALVEVIAVVLEAGFSSTLSLRFNDLGGFRLQLVHGGRPRHECDYDFRMQAYSLDLY